MENSVYLPPPYRIKMVEPVRLISREEREAALHRAGFNLFNLRSDEVFIDLLTDSGTGAMSQAQWAALMGGDEAYANARSFIRFRDTVSRIMGFPEVIPTHQGRGAENILLGYLLRGKPGTWVVSNTSFDTTVGHILHNKCKPVNIPVPELRNRDSDFPFKGNMDTTELHRLLEECGSKISLVTLVLTNNAGGGQPASLANVQAVSELCAQYGKLFFLDISRIVENSWFIQQREIGCQHLSLEEIVHKTCSFADGVWMSAKKDAFANAGGLLALNDSELARHLREQLILFEGFPTYGGLSGRDLETIATGLDEAVRTEAVKYRINQTAYLVNALHEAGIPVLRPAGGHAAYVDARAFLPHIPVDQFPGQALACALYREGGIRSVEIGSLMFGRNENGVFMPAAMELVRLALPRRTYEKAHIDYVIRNFVSLREHKDNIHGFTIIQEPELLRHFSCTLAEV